MMSGENRSGVAIDDRIGKGRQEVPGTRPRKVFELGLGRNHQINRALPGTSDRSTLDQATAKAQAVPSLDESKRLAAFHPDLVREMQDHRQGHLPGREITAQ